MMGSNGVMMGTRIVVSAEWVEMMRQLVRAGVLSLPAVSAIVRIQAGQVMMAQGLASSRGACTTRSATRPRCGDARNGQKRAPVWPSPRVTTSCRRSSASGSRSAASLATWTLTSSASRWSSLTTRLSTAGATGSLAAHGPVNGTGCSWKLA